MVCPEALRIGSSVHTLIREAAHTRGVNAVIIDEGHQVADKYAHRPEWANVMEFCGEHANGRPRVVMTATCRIEVGSE